MVKRLYNLNPAEVSLVGKGANKKKFLVFKSANGVGMNKQQIEASLKALPKETLAKIESVVKSMKSAVLKDNQAEGGEAADQSQPLDDHAQAALKAVARILAPHKDKITDEHLDAVQKELGIGSSATEGGEGGEGEDEGGEVQMSRSIPENVEEEHHIAALGRAEKAYHEELTKMGYQKNSDPSKDSSNGVTKTSEEEDEEEIDKSNKEDDVSKVNKSAVDLSMFPEKQRAQLELIFKANADLIEDNKAKDAKIEELEKVVKSEQDIRTLGEFREKARGFKHIGANTEELAVIMKSMSDKDPEGYKKMEAVLKAADEHAGKAGLFEEIGSRQGGGNLSDPDMQLEKLVDSYVAKSTTEETREEIYDRVVQTKEGKRLMAESIKKNQNVRA